MQESKQNKLALLQQMIENAERNITAAKHIVKEINTDNNISKKSEEISQIVEGAFDGQKMVSMEGKSYPVPPNYASKSKLVEGDILKLTITEDGSFVYKKISSVPARKIIGLVMKDGSDRYYVSAEGRKYNVLFASITYFKAEEGNEVVIVVPKEKVSSWAAVESIIKEGENAGDFIGEDSNQESLVNNEEDWEDKSDFLKESDNKDSVIEDEWTPNIDDIKKEGSFDDQNSLDEAISDDFSN